MRKSLLIAFGCCALLGAGLLISRPAEAQTRTSIATDYPSLYRGTRPLGMGNAFLALKGTDENAAFYNPAAINDYTGFHMALLSPGFDFSLNAVTLVTDAFDTFKDMNKLTTTTAKVDKFNQYVKKHTGDFTSLDIKMPALAAYSKWFFAGLILDSRTTFAFRSPSDTKFEVRSRNDGGLYLGSAYPFLDDQLQVGLGMKILYRMLVDEVLTSTDAIASSSFTDAIDTKKRGMGVGFDLGLKGKIPTGESPALQYLKPTAALVWQDIADTRFANNAGRNTQSISTGVAIHPDLAQWGVGGIESSLALDFRELNQQVAFTKKINVGYEVRLPRIFLTKLSARVGGNKGYFTTGATVDFRFLKADFAFFQEEVGSANRQKGDSRIAASLMMGF